MILGPEVVVALIIRFVILAASLLLPLLLSVCLVVYILIRRAAFKTVFWEYLLAALVLVALTLIPTLLFGPIFDAGVYYFIYAGILADIAVIILWRQMAKKKLTYVVGSSLIAVVFSYVIVAVHAI